MKTKEFQSRGYKKAMDWQNRANDHLDGTRRQSKLEKVIEIARKTPHLIVPHIAILTNDERNTLFVRIRTICPETGRYLTEMAGRMHA